jgi:hypothetical protein
VVIHICKVSQKSPKNKQTNKQNLSLELHLLDYKLEIIKMTNFQHNGILAVHLTNLTIVGSLIVGTNNFANTLNYFWILL